MDTLRDYYWISDGADRKGKGKGKGQEKDLMRVGIPESQRPVAEQVRETESSSLSLLLILLSFSSYL